ncbi:MAG: hypothetical protein ACK5LT_08950 [Lachnospirales bacterium]
MKEIFLISEEFKNTKVEYNKNSRMYVSDWKVYFEFYEVATTLYTAALAGPPAIMAALAGVASIAGPAGTIIGGAIGFFGAGPIIYAVTQAAVYGKGFYIGFDWNGVFPNPVMGSW